eukprot:CAMPEP_0197186638 /NCGR_PEP_ID=MMETSP1423-20130617/14303_1 /TAXON_ID=476441 /ORGANISM="Pseudo-nitzschia heimii, Strain UNC1101" /LENGTH=405 /DNA_ID=CAMNT_0042638009 /DNA_START=530 /DNA_END=1747 /DNA_ORIENTATION=+
MTATSRGRQGLNNRNEGAMNCAAQSDKENRSVFHHSQHGNIISDDESQTDNNEDFVSFRSRQERTDRPVAIPRNDTFRWFASTWFESDEDEDEEYRSGVSHSESPIGIDLLQGLDLDLNLDDGSIGDYELDDDINDRPVGRGIKTPSGITPVHEGAPTVVSTGQAPPTRREPTPDADGATYGRRIRRRLNDSVPVGVVHGFHSDCDCRQMWQPESTIDRNNEASIEKDSVVVGTMITTTKVHQDDALAFEEISYPERCYRAIDENGSIYDVDYGVDTLKSLECDSDDPIVQWGGNEPEKIPSGAENRHKTSQGGFIGDGIHHRERIKTALSREWAISLSRISNAFAIGDMKDDIGLQRIDPEAIDRWLVDERESTNRKRNHPDTFGVDNETSYSKRIKALVFKPP